MCRHSKWWQLPQGAVSQVHPAVLSGRLRSVPLKVGSPSEETPRGLGARVAGDEGKLQPPPQGALSWLMEMSLLGPGRAFSDKVLGECFGCEMAFCRLCLSLLSAWLFATVT